MVETRIVVDSATRDRVKLLKRGGETVDEVIKMMLDELKRREWRKE